MQYLVGTRITDTSRQSIPISTTDNSTSVSSNQTSATTSVDEKKCDVMATDADKRLSSRFNQQKKLQDQWLKRSYM